MSSEVDDQVNVHVSTFSARRWFGWSVGLAAIFTIIGYGLHRMIPESWFDLRANEWGDFLGGLFGTLSFVGVVIGLGFQNSALHAQLVELRHARDAAKQQAGASEEAANALKAQLHIFLRQADLLMQQTEETKKSRQIMSNLGGLDFFRKAISNLDEEAESMLEKLLDEKIYGNFAASLKNGYLNGGQINAEHRTWNLRRVLSSAHWLQPVRSTGGAAKSKTPTPEALFFSFGTNRASVRAYLSTFAALQNFLQSDEIFVPFSEHPLFERHRDIAEALRHGSDRLKVRQAFETAAT